MKPWRSATAEWRVGLRPRLTMVRETLVLDRPLLFSRTRDKPVLLTALAEECSALLALDRGDFSEFINTRVYGLWVRTPAAFPVAEREQERPAL